MIKKIISINDVGRFVDCPAKNDVEFQKVTVIYAENARGKTTLTSILRSLCSGQADLIKERKTLGSTQQQEVKILTDSGVCQFKDDCWDQTHSDIYIFDQQFITENVHSGDYVDTDHKRNHYGFVIGEEGVILADKVDKCDEDVKIAMQDLKELGLRIEKHIVDDTEIDIFIGLEQIPEIEREIKAKKTEIKALEMKNQILEKPYPDPVKPLLIPTEGIIQILAKEIVGISTRAEDLVKAHLSRCMDDKGEAWVNKGLSYVKDASCPFCGQSLEASELYSLYKDYFSQSYKELIQEINSMCNEVRDLSLDNYLIDLQQVISNNILLGEFWQPYVNHGFPKIDYESIKVSYQNAKTLLNEQLDLKSKNPLDKINISENVQESLEPYYKAIKEIENYNLEMKNIIDRIKKVKSETSLRDIENEEKRLLKLENVEARFKPECEELCRKYVLKLTEKLRLEKEKTVAKKALDAFSDSIVSKYGGNINKILMKFGTTFSIKDFHKNYMGRKPRTEYKIEINKVSVPSALPKKESSARPYFKNTLSSGDRSTLAFAFFFARLVQDQNLKDKVVIFDDPISSMDSFRKTTTEQLITRIQDKVKQIIIFSHDPLFLKVIWSKLGSGNVKTLEIVLKGDDCIIQTWDIVSQTRNKYFRDYHLLNEYLVEGSSRDKLPIVQCIRPLLEGNLRYRFPGEFPENNWLGEYVRLIKESKEGDELYCLKTYLNELTDLKDFSKKFHHEFNPNYGNEPIQDATLGAYARRTLKFIRGA